MSDIPTDGVDGLNIRDILARIDRQQAETRKFVAEHDKLAAEAAKLNRDRAMAPWQFAAAFMGAGAALFGAGAAFWKVVGMTPTRLRECLELLRWSQRGLADALGRDEGWVRMMARGTRAIPEELATWLETLAAVHATHPVPDLPDGRRRVAA